MVLFYKQAHLDLNWTETENVIQMKASWYQIISVVWDCCIVFLRLLKEIFAFVKKYYKCVADGLMRLRWWLKKADGERKRLGGKSCLVCVTKAKAFQEF